MSKKRNIRNDLFLINLLLLTIKTEEAIHINKDLEKLDIYFKKAIYDLINNYFSASLELFQFTLQIIAKHLNINQFSRDDSNQRINSEKFDFDAILSAIGISDSNILRTLGKYILNDKSTTYGGARNSIAHLNCKDDLEKCALSLIKLSTILIDEFVRYWECKHK